MKNDRNSNKPFKDGFDKTSPAAVTAVYLTSLLLAAVGASQIYGGIEGGQYYLFSGLLFFITAAAVQLGAKLMSLLPGPKAEYVSDYDRMIIDGCFVHSAYRNSFYGAIEDLHEGEFENALEKLRDIEPDRLSDKEKGVLSFYTSVCYSRLGYPTNAARFALDASEKNVGMPESLLMAARDYALAGSKFEAEECYNKLLPIAEERHIFPFIFNEMGKFFITADKPDDAERMFRKSMEYGLDPINSQAGMALVKLMQHKPDEAAGWYRLALISRVPDMQGFRELCGQICTASGYPKDLLDTYTAEKYAVKREEHFASE